MVYIVCIPWLWLAVALIFAYRFCRCACLHYWEVFSNVGHSFNSPKN